MANHNHNNSAGLPEWGISDEDAAAAAAVVAPAVQDDDTTSSWLDAAKYYWSSAYLALDAGDRQLARNCARQAQDAESKGSPEGRLLAGVFGLSAPDADVAQKGARIAPDLAKKARAAVLAALSISSQPTPRRAAQPPKGRISQPKKVAATKPHHKAVVDLLTQKGPLDEAAILAAGIQDVDARTINSMARKGIITLNRRGKYCAV